jgi:hypothetical protein
LHLAQGHGSSLPSDLCHLVPGRKGLWTHLLLCELGGGAGWEASEFCEKANKILLSGKNRKGQC